MKRLIALAASLPLIVLAAGCGGSSGTPTVTVQPARTFKLVGFEPSQPVPAGKPVPVSFTIEQPSGKPLTSFKTGSGPHTGVHLIFVRDDLAEIVHKHPPIDSSGRIGESIVFPEPGRYRAIVDVYPKLGGSALRNFQLFDRVRVSGKATNEPIPPPSPSATVDGYRVTLHGHPKLRAITPAFLHFTVTDPQGKPARFTPWFGALAHAIFFHARNLDYFHTHVCSPGATGCTSVLGGARVTGKSTTPGKLDVGVLLPEPGTWRLFLQMRSNGRVLTAPFTLDVK